MNRQTTRIMDEAGRISIPGYLRKLANINPGDTVSVQVSAQGAIHIYLHEDRCCICGERQDDDALLTAEIGPSEKQVCRHCARTFANKLTNEEEFK